MTRNFWMAGCLAEIQISNLNTSEDPNHPSPCHGTPHISQFVSAVELPRNVLQFNIFPLVTFSFSDSKSVITVLNFL
jgi:hypothetical protein